MKQYWRDIEELNDNSLSNNKPSTKKEEASLSGLIDKKSGASRRDFLKLFGFSIASTSILASCERPITKAIPYLVKPETITPGKADYYASTFYDGEEYGSILVKVRDGRPIKIEGNDLCPYSNGSTSSISQASVLELYDENRIGAPYLAGEESTWEKVDAEILEKTKQDKV